MDTNAPPSPPPPPPPATPLPPRRPLRRDRANGVLGGVAAGIAETYGLDVTLVRVMWIVAAILQVGIPAYIIAWIAIAPAEGQRERHNHSRDIGTYLGLAAVALGVVIVTGRLFPHGWRFSHFGFPLLLIGGGLAILVARRRDAVADDALPPAPPAPPAPPSPPGPFAPPGSAAPAPADSSTWTASASDDPTAPALLTEPAAPTQESPAVPPSAWTQTAPWPVPPSARTLRRASRRDRRAQRARPFITPITLSVLLIGAGIAGLLQATGALDVNLTVLLAIGTAVVGAALVVAAFAGRAHTLILVGLVLLGATAISNTIDVPLRGGIGDHSYRPLQRSELQSHYELGIGQLELDLRDVPLAGRTTVVDAQTGIGQVLVLVPSSVRVEVHAHAGAGAAELWGRQSGGWPENDERAIDGTGPGVLQLDLRVGAGDVRVRRYEPSGVETILSGNPSGDNGFGRSDFGTSGAGGNG